MWRGYGGGPYGVAIRTTFDLLNDLVPLKVNILEGLDVTILMRRVRYIDHTSLDQRIEGDNNALGLIMSKSVVYNHESEVRAIFLSGSGPLGRTIPVDLQKLVSAVMVSPLAPSWFEDVVKRTIEAAGLSFPIIRSLAAGPPVF